MPLLPVRLSALTHHLATSLAHLRHDTNNAPLVRILSRVPTQRTKNLGDPSETGSTVSLVFLSVRIIFRELRRFQYLTFAHEQPDGSMISNSFIEHAATQHKISLRTGCVCNPGGAAAILNIESDMGRLHAGVTLRDFERQVGRELGVVRISLGLASTYDDVYKVLKFASLIACQKSREEFWREFQAQKHD